jgi:hypothetical protein
MRSYPARLFAGLGLILLALAPPLNYSADGASMLAVAQSLVHHATITVPCAVGIHGRGGACYSTFYLLLSVVLVPFVAVGRLVGQVVGTSPTYLGAAAALAAPALCTAGAATLCAMLARERGATRRAATWAAVAAVFGTEALTYSRTLFAEPLGALCVSLAAWGLTGSTRRRQALGALGCALTVMAKPQLLLAAPAVGLVLAVRDHRVRPALTAVCATLSGTVLVLGYNALRFGSPSDFGGADRKLYVGGHPGGQPAVLKLANGAAELLFSPNHGLLFFAPVALLGCWSLARARPLDRIALACLAGAAGVFAFYVIQPVGNAWGTRYLVPLMPLLCVGLASLTGRALKLGVILAVGVAVSQIPTTVGYFESSYRDDRAGAPGAWELRRLQLIEVWPATVREVRRAAHTNPRALARAAVASGRPDNRLLNTVALWWWMLPAAGLPAWIGALFACLMIALGVNTLVSDARSGWP